MNQLFSFAIKEFRHIGRDWRSLAFLVGLPIMQMLIFGFALSNEVKDAPFAVVDYARDDASQQIIERMRASNYFQLAIQLDRAEDIEAAFRRDQIKMALVFPPDFGTAIRHNQETQIQVIADASDPNLATSITNYATAIVADYQQTLYGEAKPPYQFAIETRMLYNPQLKSAYNFVPGVMTLILMLISAMMTAVAIVREKELGTMEVLLVSPAQPLVIAVSKMIPYFLISFLNLINILLLSYFVLDVPIRGQLILLIGVCIIYLITSLSLGLLISSATNSQQVALFISLIGLMMPTLIFSGFMFPIENMPLPMQYISKVVPASWFFTIVRDVMIKGLGWSDIWPETLVLVAMTIFFLGMSVRKFQIRLG